MLAHPASQVHRLILGRVGPIHAANHLVSLPGRVEFGPFRAVVTVATLVGKHRAVGLYYVCVCHDGACELRGRCLSALGSRVTGVSSSVSLSLLLSQTSLRDRESRKCALAFDF